MNQPQGDASDLLAEERELEAAVIVAASASALLGMRTRGSSGASVRRRHDGRGSERNQYGRRRLTGRSVRSMKIVITLANGKKHDLLMDVSDANEWMRRFGAIGTSALGDWVEVVPEAGAGRTFVRSSEVITVQLIADGEDSQAIPPP